MTSTKLNRVFFALIALSLCGVIILLLWQLNKSQESQVSAADGDKTETRRELEELHQKYARVQSVHVMNDRVQQRSVLLAM